MCKKSLKSSELLDEGLTITMRFYYVSVFHSFAGLKYGFCEFVHGAAWFFRAATEVRNTGKVYCL